MELFFDTETTGLPLYKEDPTHPGQPEVIQLAAILSDETKIYTQISCLLDPTCLNPDWDIHPKAQEAHGISVGDICKAGLTPLPILLAFIDLVEKADVLVCHNTDFDKKLMLAMLAKANLAKEDYETIEQGTYYCTMKRSTNLCKLPGRYGFKWPKLIELHQFLFDEGFEGAHDALADVMATRRCYYELIRRGI